MSPSFSDPAPSGALERLPIRSPKGFNGLLREVRAVAHRPIDDHSANTP